jgi:hypothetical protein
MQKIKEIQSNVLAFIDYWIYLWDKQSITSWIYVSYIAGFLRSNCHNACVLNGCVNKLGLGGMQMKVNVSSIPSVWWMETYNQIEKYPS